MNDGTAGVDDAEARFDRALTQVGFFAAQQHAGPAPQMRREIRLIAQPLTMDAEAGAHDLGRRDLVVAQIQQGVLLEDQPRFRDRQWLAMPLGKDPTAADCGLPLKQGP